MMKYGAYTTEQSMSILRSTACGQAECMCVALGKEGLGRVFDMFTFHYLATFFSARGKGAFLCCFNEALRLNLRSPVQFGAA